MNNFKIQFTLKQHTPLIHFRPHEEGATLRATEVKPKLDRFILNHLQSIAPNLYEQNEDLINSYFPKKNGKRAGEYKMHISGNVRKKYLIGAVFTKKEREYLQEQRIPFLNYTSYFADAKPIRDGVKQRKKSINEFEGVHPGVNYQDLKLELFSYHPPLIDFLQKIIPYFLAIENFGTRQSKGFGCFSCAGMEEVLEETLSNHPEIITVFRKYNSSNYSKKLKIIREDFQRLKAGYNFRDDYQKSILWQYLCEEGNIGWEKKKIKQTLKNNFSDVFWNLKGDNRGMNRNHLNNEQFEYQYVRALLGLAEHNEYGTQNNRDEIKVKIHDPTKEVERFQSPIQFKVFNDYIYLVGWKIPEKLVWIDKSKNIRRKFDFILNANLNQRFTEKKLGTLEVPANFSLSDFLDSALNEDNHSSIDKLSYYEKIY